MLGEGWLTFPVQVHLKTVYRHQNYRTRHLISLEPPQASWQQPRLSVGLGIAATHESFIPTACHQRSRVFCADGARSGFEYCFQDFDTRPSTEKPSAGMFFVLSSLAFRGRDVQPIALRHVQILRENAQRPQSQLVRCKNPERWQYHAPPRGGASRSSRKSCSKSGDGFLP